MIIWNVTIPQFGMSRPPHAVKYPITTALSQIVLNMTPSILNPVRPMRIAIVRRTVVGIQVYVTVSRIVTAVQQGQGQEVFLILSQDVLPQDIYKVDLERKIIEDSHLVPQVLFDLVQVHAQGCLVLDVGQGLDQEAYLCKYIYYFKKMC